jgi:hypothetical protein
MVSLEVIAHLALDGDPHRITPLPPIELLLTPFLDTYPGIGKV